MLVVVPVDPPRAGLALPSLVENAPLSATAACRLYEASVVDVLRAVASSGGELLVNYRDAETLPDDFAYGDPEDEVRGLATDALGVPAENNDEDDTDSIRFERQVGSSRSARVGNTVTHLLEREDVGSVGVLEPTAALVRRTELDGAAMSTRRNDVVLGPSSDGGSYLAAFRDPIDFTDAYAGPELPTLAERARDADLDVGFAPMLPTVATSAGLRSTVSLLEAQGHAGTLRAEATAAVVDDLGLSVGAGGTLERA